MSSSMDEISVVNQSTLHKYNLSPIQYLSVVIPKRKALIVTITLGKQSSFETINFNTLFELFAGIFFGQRNSRTN